MAKYNQKNNLKLNVLHYNLYNKLIIVTNYPFFIFTLLTNLCEFQNKNKVLVKDFFKNKHYILVIIIL